MRRNYGAVAIGTGVFVGLSLTHLFIVPLIASKPPAPIVLLAVLAPYLSAFVAAAVAGYRARTRPTIELLILLIVLGILMVVTTALLNLGAFYFGLPVDFFGWVGTAFLALLALPLYVGLALAGGILGALLHPSAAPGRMHAA
jgi:hypothetical protein